MSRVDDYETDRETGAEKGGGSSAISRLRLPYWREILIILLVLGVLAGLVWIAQG